MLTVDAEAPAPLVRAHGQYVIVVELVDGHRLKHRVRGDTPADVCRALRSLAPNIARATWSVERAPRRPPP